MSLRFLALAALCGAVALPWIGSANDADARSLNDVPARMKVHVSMLPLTMDLAARAASDCVHVRIDGMRESLHSSGLPSTFYSATPLRSVRGNHEANLQIVVGGAESIGVPVSVEGAPHFRVGEEYVLFLAQDPADGSHAVVGLSQGVLAVERQHSVVVGPLASGLETVSEFFARVTTSFQNSKQK